MFAKKFTTKGNTENYENENIGGENYEVTVYTKTSFKKSPERGMHSLRRLI